jgi:hypothetical protein
VHFRFVGNGALVNKTTGINNIALVAAGQRFAAAPG